MNPRPPEPLPLLPPPLGAILAGGASRRFGSPKALALVAGVPAVERVRRALDAAGADVVLIANEPGLFHGLGLRTRPDEVRGAGPLGGIHAALRWAREEGRPGALCVACDLPFVPAGLLRLLVETARQEDADAVVPEDEGGRGAAPLCAFWSPRALPEAEAMLAADERRVMDLLARVRTARIPLAAVRRFGPPERLFLNVNTPDDHRRAEDLARAVPPAVAVVGRKNSGKTTLVVALVAELKRRGLRVATLKHGHHAFEFDQPGRDSWRHVHEGGAEAVIMASGSKVGVVMHRDDGEPEPDPRELIHRFYGGRGYDVVVVEGYKAGPFPRIEVFRRAVHPRPLHDPAETGWLAVVTDDPGLIAGCPLIALEDGGAHVARVADLVERRVLSRGEPDGA